MYKVLILIKVQGVFAACIDCWFHDSHPNLVGARRGGRGGGDAGQQKGCTVCLKGGQQRHIIFFIVKASNMVSLLVLIQDRQYWP